MSTSPMPDPTGVGNVVDGGQAITQQAQQLPSDTQAPQAPQQAAPPAMPASPDQGGPVPSGGQAQDNPNTHGWRAVLKGALGALENHLKGAGEGLITGGIPGAVIGAASPGMADKAMQYRQRMQRAAAAQAEALPQFTNAQAASTIADAHLRDMQREQMPKQLQLERDKLEADQADKWLSMGVLPSAVIDNTADGAAAGLKQLAAANGGQVPPVVTFHVGDKILAFDPTALASNSGVLNDVNDARRVLGAAEFPNSLMLNKQANKVHILQDAASVFNPVSPGKDSKASNAQVNQYQGYLNTVKAWPDDAKNKQPILDKLQKAYDIVKKSHDQNLAEDLQKATARGASSQNARMVQTTDASGNQVYTPQAKAEGKTVGSSGAEFNKDYIKPAQDAETAYQMFNQAYADFKAGAKTGAPSMLALSQHLSTTFGNVKGARITKDMIQEHLGARSVSDSAVVAVQKLVNGDALAPNQWEAFRGLIGQARFQQWAKVRREGEARGFTDIQSRVPQDLGGKLGGATAPAAATPSSSDPFAQFGGKAR